MDNMTKIQIGQPFAPIAGKPEGVIFEATASGYILIYNYLCPGEDEIAQMHQNKPFEIAFSRQNGSLWILTKCGTLNWNDAPFHPALSQGWEALQNPGEAEGSALTLIMTDAADTTVKSLRLIGLGHDFSVQLIDAIHDLARQPFDRAIYMRGVSDTMALYKTEELLDLSIARWALK